MSGAVEGAVAPAVAWKPKGVHACPHCDETFARDQFLALHQGRAHGAHALAPAERARFEAALAEEEAWLARLRKHVKGGLNALPWAILYVLLMLMLTLSDVPLFFALLPAPGAIALTGFFYYLGYTSDKRGQRPAPRTCPPGEEDAE